MSPKLQEKLLKIESELVEHAFPPQLVIENTSACNQACIHCSHSELTRPKKHMARPLWDKIVREVAQVAPNTEIWPTFYGEALVMGDELWDRIDDAAAVGCNNLVLNSNATLIARKNHMARILASPLKRFILSLDGLSPETYEKIRVHGKWDVVYPAVEELLRRKAQLNQIYPAIICQFSLMEENEHEAAAFRDYWQQRGAEVKIRPKLEWAANGSIRSNFIDHESEFRIACPWGNNTMAIHQDGSVVACAIDYDAKVRVGNINEISVQEAWQRLGEVVRKPHRQHRWNDLPDLCKGCRDWQTAGSNYERESVPGTRPFWYRADEHTDEAAERTYIEIRQVHQQPVKETC